MENAAFFSIIELARKLKVHPNTIRRAIKSNRIVALRIGKSKNSSYRIPASEIHRIAQIDLEDVIENEVQRRLKEYLDLDNDKHTSHNAL